LLFHRRLRSLACVCAYVCVEIEFIESVQEREEENRWQGAKDSEGEGAREEMEREVPQLELAQEAPHPQVSSARSFQKCVVGGQSLMR
jgi:hypothetical protein